MWFIRRESNNLTLVNNNAQIAHDVFSFVLLDLLLDLCLMIEIVTERVVDFGGSEVGVTLQVSLDRFAKMQDRFGYLPDGNAGAAKDGPPVEDAGNTGDVWVFSGLALGGRAQTFFQRFKNSLLVGICELLRQRLRKF